MLSLLSPLLRRPSRILDASADSLAEYPRPEASFVKLEVSFSAAVRSASSIDLTIFRKIGRYPAFADLPFPNNDFTTDDSSLSEACACTDFSEEKFAVPVEEVFSPSRRLSMSVPVKLDFLAEDLPFFPKSMSIRALRIIFMMLEDLGMRKPEEREVPLLRRAEVPVEEDFLRAVVLEDAVLEDVLPVPVRFLV